MHKIFIAQDVYIFLWKYAKYNTLDLHTIVVTIHSWHYKQPYGNSISMYYRSMGCVIQAKLYPYFDRYINFLKKITVSFRLYYVTKTMMSLPFMVSWVAFFVKSTSTSNKFVFHVDWIKKHINLSLFKCRPSIYRASKKKLFNSNSS